jgi:serine/threonine protein kinase
MPAQASCPPSGELEQFLLGRLEDEDSLSLEFHLAGCTVCQQQLTTIAAEDEFVQALRQHSQPTSRVDSATQLTEAPEELVSLLVPHYKQIASAFEETAAFVSSAGLGEVSTRNSRPQFQSPLSDAATPTTLGRYEIRGILGHGGMGTVLHGFDPLLKRSLAIKVIRSKLLSQEMSARLVREAQAAAAVEHDHIVAVYAVEIYDDAPCIMMPLLRGVTLKQRLEETAGPLPLAEILRIGREAASGLAAAHAAGLIHCDIKPANLWLEAPSDRVKVLDFGLAIVRDDQAGDSTEVAGTPGFIAPEQARGQALDQRTDVFSLGCVLYRMATGEAPFTGERHTRALWTVISDPPPPALQKNAAVPAELSDLIERMLSRDPKNRPASAADVVAALEALERRLHEQQQRVLRRRWLAAMFVVALLSGCGVAMWGMFTAPTEATPVQITFSGDEPPLEVMLRCDGKEQTLTLGREKTLELPPGDYTVRAVQNQTKRVLVPDRFSVVAEQPQTLRIALVGEVSRHEMHTGPVTGVAVQSGEKATVYSVGLDRALVAWEANSTNLPKFVDLPHSARCVAVSPKGDDVATAGGNKFPPAELAIRIFKTSDLTPRGNSLDGHTRMINALAYSPTDKQLASAGADGVFLWNTSTGDSQLLGADNPEFIYALAYSANGQHLVTGNDEGLVVVWDIRKRVRLKTYNTGPSPVRAVAFLSERVVSAGDDGTLRIWNAGALQHEWLGHTAAVQALAVSPNSRQVLSGDAEGNLRLWSVATGKTVQNWTGHKETVNAIAFLSNGRQAVSGGADGAVSLWQLPFSD